MTQSIARLNPASLPNAAELGYSQISIVEPGRMAYVSGQVAWQPGGKPVPTSLAEQAELVAANAKAALDALGATRRYCDRADLSGRPDAGTNGTVHAAFACHV